MKPVASFACTVRFSWVPAGTVMFASRNLRYCVAYSLEFTYTCMYWTVAVSVVPAFTWKVVPTVAPFAGVQIVTVRLVVLRRAGGLRLRGRLKKKNQSGESQNRGETCVSHESDLGDVLNAGGAQLRKKHYPELRDVPVFVIGTKSYCCERRKRSMYRDRHRLLQECARRVDFMDADGMSAHR